MGNILIDVRDNEKILKTSEKPNFAKVVSYKDGKAKIVIDGELETDGIAYECVQTCAPNNGDRVFFVRTGSTLVILGVIGKNGGVSVEHANTANEAKRAKEADHATAAESANTANTAINFSGKHTGSRLSFFNAAQTAKKTTTTLSVNANLSQVISKVNELIIDLKSYGLE